MSGASSVFGLGLVVFLALGVVLIFLSNLPSDRVLAVLSRRASIS